MRASAGRLVQGRADSLHDGVISAGMSIVAPAGQDAFWQGDAARSARLRVPVALVQDAADEIGKGGQGRVEIRNVFRATDRVIEHFTSLLLREIDRASHPVQGLIVEALSCGLAAHLLRAYDTRDRLRVFRNRSWAGGS